MKEFDDALNRTIKKMENTKREAVIRNYDGLRAILEPYFKYADEHFRPEDPKRNEYIQTIVKILNAYMDIATELATNEHEVEIAKQCMIRLSYDIVNLSLKEK